MLRAGEQQWNNNWPCGQNGFSLVEAILVLGIFSIIAVAAVTLALGAFSADERVARVLQAQALASEGLEAVRSIRGNQFSDLTVGTFGLATSPGYWVLSGNGETIGLFTREVRIGEVYRNDLGRGDIVSAGSPGATLDQFSRRVTSTVSWVGALGSPQSLSLATLLTEWTAISWRLDTVADFSAGRFNSARVTSGGNGGIELVGFGTWTGAGVLRTVNIAGNEDVADCVVDSAQSVAYVATKARGSGRPEFYAFDIADVTPTTTALYMLGTTELGQSVNALTVHNGYAFMASGDNGQEMMVVRLSDYAKLTSWDTPSTNADANGIAATGTVAYLITDESGSRPEFYAVNIANPAAIPAAPLGTAEISDDVNAVAVSADGRYAFLATDDNDGELTVVRLSDYQVVRRIDAGGTSNATGVAVSGNTVALVKNQGSGAEFFVYDGSNPETMSATPLGTAELNRDATHVAVQGNRAYVSTQSSSGELLVINLDTYATQVVDLPGSSSAPSVSMLGAYAYVVSNGNSQELMVVQGNGTAAVYPPVGIFTSPSFDSGSAATLWGDLSWTLAGTGTVKFKLRTADTFTHLQTARWVGSDGTEATYYTGSGQAIIQDPGATGSRWIQLRAYLETTDPATTPILEDVTVSYSQ